MQQGPFPNNPYYPQQGNPNPQKNNQRNLPNAPFPSQPGPFPAGINQSPMPVQQPYPTQQAVMNNAAMPFPTGQTQQPWNPAAAQSAIPHYPGGMHAPTFLQDLTSSNPLAGMAMNQASTFLQSKTGTFLPGAYGIWGALKCYFCVDNVYVVTKLKTILFPFTHGSWRRATGASKGVALPDNDINALDLYLPLMSFITYILLVGYVKGTSGQFSPDTISDVALYCTIMQLVEISFIAFLLYLLRRSIPFLDLLALTGYKYIPLVINMNIYVVFGKSIYYLAMLYTGFSIAYFTLNTLKGMLDGVNTDSRKFRNYILFGIACLQYVLVWWNAYI